MFNKPANFKRTSQSGVATLPTIILLSILILAVGISITALSLSENFITLGQKQTTEALTYAEVGARDALIRLARNKNYTCVTTDCYTVDTVTNGCSTTNGCARVTVSAGVGSSGDPKIITSKGVVKNISRRLQVSVVFDASLNGQISNTTWTELSD